MLLSCHVRGSESIYTLRICLNVKELFAWKRRHIWNLSDCNGIRIHNHFVHKQILSHFAKLATFVCELSGCVFESLCSHLNFRYDMSSLTFRKNYRVQIHSEPRTWHDDNIQSNAPYRLVLTTQLNHLASLAKWLSVRLRTKWSWLLIPSKSFIEGVESKKKFFRQSWS